MNKKRSVTALFSAAALCASLTVGSLSAYTADDTVHTVTVYDFDGKVMAELSVADGEAPDLGSIDTSVLERHNGIYTQIGFDSWSSYPGKITADTAIYALYKEMTISLVDEPVKREYYSREGDIDLSGLKVTITVNRQLPEKDEDGSFIIDTEVLNIESKCSAVPDTLGEAFADGDSAKVKVYPIGSDKEILSYDISCYPSLGDADFNGSVNASDASAILIFYSLASTGQETGYVSDQKKRCDVDGNGLVDSNDASLVLGFYSSASTGKLPSWDDILARK